MIYSIENKQLKVAVDTAGAQLSSIYSKTTDTEYLWQGDPAYWTGRAYNIFPYVGRLYNGVYTYGGKEYSFKLHGIARYMDFTLTDRTATKLEFLLKDSEETLKQYPFRFELYVRYEIQGKKLVCTMCVRNIDEKEMIFVLGGHPGFNVPFKNGMFEDYYLEFAEPTNVMSEQYTDKGLMTNKQIPYELTDGVRIDLKHELFDRDALILANTCRSVSLKNKTNARKLVFDYPDFRYLGIWHAAKTDAPYVCLEPWTALPSTDGQTEVLETKQNATHLASGKSHNAVWSVEIFD